MNRNRYLEILAVAVMAGIFSGVVLNQLFTIFTRGESAVAQPTSQSLKVIRAEKFELVGKTGTRRALLELEPHGEPALKLYDAAGSLRVALSLRSDGGPNLLLWDGRTAVPRFGLALLPNGSPSVELADRNGDLRVVFGLGTDGEPVLGLFDQKGNLHTILGRATGEEPAS
jgi:hypothetical protein